MNKSNAETEIINFPIFISSNPCGEDQFESKSQERIAGNISNIIKNNDSCHIIGIDGEWGSGKSNVVKMVQDKLEKEEYHFFVYDAWGHQEDLQRRSILEELTQDLSVTHGILDNEEWEKNLKQLLAKSKETEKKTIPSLSLGIVVSLLVLISTPVVKIISDTISDIRWKIFVMAIPLLAFIILYIFYVIKERNENKKAEGDSRKLKKKNIWRSALKRLFHIYQKHQIEDTTFETISEDEPSVSKFRKWMKDISDSLGEKQYRLVLVFDNMDRLPVPKVKDLWASIHTFFAEKFYDNVWVIVPFDRAHIQAAFRELNANSTTNYGNDFINKTFSVVYRVSLPILSDWKRFFEKKWGEAFGVGYRKEEYEKVVQIYDILGKDITPRRVIAFINELVSIKQNQPDIPGEYIALFILKKAEILSKAFEEIIKPTYLEGVTFIYGNDDKLAENIGALVYQIEAPKAIQVIYTDKLTRALNNNDIGSATTIGQSGEFEDILGKAVPGVANLHNTILCLDFLEKKDTSIQLSVWNDLYRRMIQNFEQGQKIKESQKILLQKTSYKGIYLGKILSDFKESQQFNSVDYYESINQLKNVIKEKDLKIELERFLPEIETKVDDFIPFVKLAKNTQQYYGIKCNNDDLDTYLSSINMAIDELEKIDFLPFIMSDYELVEFTDKLEESINANKNVPSNKALLGLLYKRYKEVFNATPLNVIIEDQFIHSFFNQSNPAEDFYYDLIGMRISKFTNMSVTYANPINAVLSKEDGELSKKLSEQIEYYVTFNNLLLNLQNFGDYPVYTEVVRILTYSQDSKSHVNLVSILQHFAVICESGKIDPLKLIQRLNEYSDQMKAINVGNLKTNIPDVLFFQSALKAENSLASNCINLLKQYLDSLTIEDWKESFEDEDSYEFQTSILLDDYRYKQDGVEAIKATLNEIADNQLPIPGKRAWENTINKLTRESLVIAFRNVRDRFYSTEIKVDSFKFFADWMFNYGDLDKRAEALRKIFTSEVLHDSNCLKIISVHINILKNIIKNADENEQTEFKSIIASLAENSDNQVAMIIAKEIGIGRKKKEGNE